jgi:hypothetical protein
VAPGAEEGDGAVLTSHGERLRNDFVARHDWIFLTPNGRFWPVARTMGERLNLTVTAASRAHPHGVLPYLAHVDVISGAVRGPAGDRDSRRAPDTRAVHTSDVNGRTGTYTLTIPFVAGAVLRPSARQRRQPQRGRLPRRGDYDTLRRSLRLTMIQPGACAGTTTLHSCRPSAG